MLPLLLSVLSLVGADRPPLGVDSLRIPILVYHNIQPAEKGTRIRNRELTMRPEVFAAQMQYLKDHGVRVLSLAEVVDALEKKRPLPHPAVVLTFDDGRVNQYENAFPVLRKHGFTATFFPFTHAIGRNPRYFTWDQLKEMKAAGMTIGSHTNLHVNVRDIRDPKQWRKEILESRELLQRKLGVPIEFFAYPFGGLSAAGDSAVRAAGYRAARAYHGGPWNRASDMIRLRAIPASESMEAFRKAIGLPPANVAAKPASPGTKPVGGRPNR